MRTRILFTSIAAFAITLIPVTSDSQCCGGGSASGGVTKGLPDFGKIVPRKRVRLTIHPGTYPQIVEVRNSQTGVIVQSIPVPAGSGTPIGMAIPIPPGMALTTKVTADPNGGGGGGTGATVNSTVENEGGDSTDGTEEECPPKMRTPNRYRRPCGQRRGF